MTILFWIVSVHLEVWNYYLYECIQKKGPPLHPDGFRIRKINIIGLMEQKDDYIWNYI